MEKPDMSEVAQRMVAATRAFVARAEKAINGRIDDIEARLKLIPAGPSGDKGEQGKEGPPGKDADQQAIIKELEPELAKLVAAIPRPRDGKDAEPVHPDSLALMVRDAVAKAVAALPAAKDGAPGRDATELTPLPGIDETRSYPAGTYAQYNGGEIRASRRTDPIKDGDISAAGWTVSREGIAALVVTQGDDPRRITVAAMMTGGTKTISEFQVPMMIYRGVFVDGRTYEQGDCVSWGAHQWHCNETTSEKPIEGGKAWTLSVKRGRDGKEGPPGPPGPKVFVNGSK